MLPIAALITADADETRFGGLDLNERAALVAQGAGINHIFFTGPQTPDLASLAGLREQGVSATTLLGWPRPFVGVPSVQMLVVLPARTIVEPAALNELIRVASAGLDSATLLVEQGPARKNNIINVESGRVTSVVGDGNATSTGIIAVPGGMLQRVRSVWTMEDAIHKFAKTGELRAVTADPYFCRQLEDDADVTAIERRYYLHTMRVAMSAAAARLLRWPASFTSSSGGRLVPVR